VLLLDTDAEGGLTCFRLSWSPASSDATFKPSLYVSMACARHEERSEERPDCNARKRKETAATVGQACRRTAAETVDTEA
jgi:hypothetical protein